jgi:hypothetical protein
METERWPARDFGDWPSCGPIRNRFMVEIGADMGIACHPDIRKSKGTIGCVRLMLKAGIDVVLHESDDDPGRLLTYEVIK